MKKLFEKFLKKLEQANKENFGNAKLDCCDLNKKGNNIHNKKQ
ncbi:LDCC motif putative metal-binding protein [Tepidibacter hydrothermalis]|uniref:LDCC motif putative metal-binding protein n=1 Tax=Tepidibacter hydrothermalis TaxID=3036126 RepID=A0ABY8E9T7_9FIRM|nr:LDCC motif putative metal-binding protein [Tepidibacter hydrothermalis]WFD09667.1 LDCC motif putative metal-binding protein [Tepidibacter hydrothermalis]